MSHHARRLVSALLAGAATAAIGCTSEPLEIPEDAQAFELRPLPGFEYNPFYSATRQRLVVRDAATWTDVWHEIARTRIPVPPAPAVDFDRDLVIVAAAGRKPSSGYGIVIDDIHVTDGGSVISITEYSPGNGCFSAAVVTTPVDVAVVQRFPGQATFLEHTAQQRDCL